jgi:dTDP-4-amino-4,6-dideoxygalactose transaminase
LPSPGTPLPIAISLGVGEGIHYPIPLHPQKAYTHLGYVAVDFPVAEKDASEILSLPMFPGFTWEQQEAVAVELPEFAIEVVNSESSAAT